VLVVYSVSWWRISFFPMANFLPIIKRSATTPIVPPAVPRDSTHASATELQRKMITKGPHRRVLV
jgi:hypothetical protein